MGRIREAAVVSHIEKQLKRRGIWFVNNHGSAFGSRGVPDFITIDDSGVLIGVEAKAPGALPYPNQLRQAIKIIQSGGRYVVAYADVDMDRVLSRVSDLPTFTMGGEIGRSEMFARDIFTTRDVTVELKISDSPCYYGVSDERKEGCNE